MANQNLSDRHNSKNKFSELTDTPTDYTGSGNNILTVNASENGIEYTSELDTDQIKDEAIDDIKLKPVDVVFTTEQLPITLTNPPDSGIADNDIAGYQMWLNHPTLELSFKAVTAAQLDKTDLNDGYPQHIHYEKGQKFWAHLQQYDIGFSAAYDNYNIIIKAKEPDPAKPHIMFIEADVMYAEGTWGKEEGDPFDQWDDDYYPYNMITNRYDWNCLPDKLDDAIRLIKETVIEDQSYLGIQPDKIDVNALAEALEALGFQKN